MTAPSPTGCVVVGPAPVPYPRCDGCAHPWHGLPCPVPTSVGRTRTCSCATSVPSPVELAEQPAHHGHLWSLPDGTGLHAPRGALARDPATGRVCCHLCGRWFVALGAHLRAHGWTARDYRQAMGLCNTTPLAAEQLSASISARQSRAYAADPHHRARMGPGQVMARTGVLAAASQRSRTRPVVAPLQRTGLERSALAAGLRTQQRRRADELATRLEGLGFRDLPEYLRTAYADGASLETLARATGLGRTRLRAALDDAAVTVRARGSNTSAARAARAGAADRAAAARVGTTDLRAWLLRRRAEGATVAVLAVEVGRSCPWVRERITG